jgi:hypothetical protein
MAKHRLQRTGRIRVSGLPVLVALVGLGGLPQAWAGQQPAMGALQNARKMQEAVQKKDRTQPEHRATTPAPPKPAAATASLAETTAGKRDPFKLPPAAGNKLLEGVPGPTGPLPPGNRGLIISQLRLEGVVHQEASNKMLAVVTNETKRAYFLTENDAVYNGVVSKITPDAVYFKENVLDQNGRVSAREVIKRLGSAPGEGR